MCSRLSRDEHVNMNYSLPSLRAISEAISRNEGLRTMYFYSRHCEERSNLITRWTTHVWTGLLCRCKRIRGYAYLLAMTVCECVFMVCSTCSICSMCSGIEQNEHELLSRHCERLIWVTDSLYKSKMYQKYYYCYLQ